LKKLLESSAGPEKPFHKWSPEYEKSKPRMKRSYINLNSTWHGHVKTFLIDGEESSK